MNKKKNKKDISRIFLWDTIIDIKMLCQTLKVGLYTSYK